MSTILDTIIARGFNLDIGNNFVAAKNQRQALDSGLQSDALQREALQFDMNQARQEAADQAEVGRLFGEFQGLQGVIPQRIQNLQESVNRGGVNPELLPRAMEMAQGDLSKVSARQQELLAKMAERSPELRDALLKSYMTPQEAQFVTLSDQEKAALGLPTDKAFQLDPNNGKISQIGGSGTTVNVGNPPSYQLTTITGPDGNPIIAAVNKENPQDVQTVGDKPTEGLSASDRSLASNKLQQIKLARQQLNNVRNRFKAINGSIAAGPVIGNLPTPDGQAFDAAVDPMRQTLLALTRVPGIGAQSDREAAIAQAPLPDRTNYPSVTEQQIQQLDQLLTTLEQGYSEMLGNGQSQATNQAVTEIEIDASGKRVK